MSSKVLRQTAAVTVLLGAVLAIMALREPPPGTSAPPRTYVYHETVIDEETGQPVEARVLMNGTEVARGTAFEFPVPVDVRAATRAEADGYQPWELTIRAHFVTDTKRFGGPVRLKWLAAKE